MSGPVNKPLPLSDEDYVRREVERLTSEEASGMHEDFWDDVEARARLSEVLPVNRPDEERVEREWTAMARGEDLALYSEFGVVR